MRLHLVAVGRARPGPERALYLHYASRLTGGIQLREVAEKRPLPAERLMAAEAELLLSAVPEGARLIALDERGRSFGSAAFAELLGRWRDDGIADIVFLVGGAGGLDERVRKRADLVLSFGAMTWPHMLVRGMLAEQLYRAQCILAGHPYHREG